MENEKDIGGGVPPLVETPAQGDAAGGEAKDEALEGEAQVQAQAGDAAPGDAGGEDPVGAPSEDALREENEAIGGYLPALKTAEAGAAPAVESQSDSADPSAEPKKGEAGEPTTPGSPPVDAGADTVVESGQQADAPLPAGDEVGAADQVASAGAQISADPSTGTPPASGDSDAAPDGPIATDSGALNQSNNSTSEDVGAVPTAAANTGADPSPEFVADVDNLTDAELEVLTRPNPNPQPDVDAGIPASAENQGVAAVSGASLAGPGPTIAEVEAADPGTIVLLVKHLATGATCYMSAAEPPVGRGNLTIMGSAFRRDLPDDTRIITLDEIVMNAWPRPEDIR